MRQVFTAVLARQAAAAGSGIALIAVAWALGLIALACAGYAIYQHLLPVHGPALAAWMSGAIFLAAAAVAGALGWYRLRRAVVVSEPPAVPRQGPEAGPDLALTLAGVIEQQLPKHAVPAAALALVGGLVVGLNPRAAETLVAALTRKHS